MSPSKNELSKMVEKEHHTIVPDRWNKIVDILVHQWIWVKFWSQKDGQCQSIYHELRANESGMKGDYNGMADFLWLIFVVPLVLRVVFTRFCTGRRAWMSSSACPCASSKCKQILLQRCNVILSGVPQLCTLSSDPLVLSDRTKMALGEIFMALLTAWDPFV